MAISRTTRTHLIYQFIILTLMFLAIGYNELLPDRKFILFLTFLPMFLYQLLVLSCCLELLPVPDWMNFFESCTNRGVETKTEKIGTDFPVASVKQEQVTKLNKDFVDLSERIKEPHRWEKSVVNLRKSSKHLAYQQKSKSWVNLSDSSKSLAETSLSREGTLDGIVPKSDRKLRSSHALCRASRAQYREDRANKAKSWRPDIAEYCYFKDSKSKPVEKVPEESIQPLPQVAAAKQEETDLSKSYSFPFRQKRLETWLEMKETETRESNQSLDMPYWQTVGYNLAVKYEARRRRRAVSSPTKLNSSGEFSLSSSFQKSIEIPREHNKQNQKKPVKNAAYCINKIKTSFSNLISKKKDEVEVVASNSHKVLKSSLSFKSKNKNISYKAKTEEKGSVSEFPQFLSNERPLIFYPKHIPFEKERFENDVQKKMVELAQEQKSLPRFQRK